MANAQWTRIKDLGIDLPEDIQTDIDALESLTNAVKVKLERFERELEAPAGFAVKARLYSAGWNTLYDGYTVKVAQVEAKPQGPAIQIRRRG